MISNKKCIPCQGGIPPLNSNQINTFIKNLDNNWKVYNEKEIKKEYIFDTYHEAISFTNKIANLAEEEGHHPFIHINYKRVVIILYTHKINGLHENDFILASKCDVIFNRIK
tara:strand:+ start:180 stop:515 length:336 start_codon:yes stop_codon:yes gene_type:complete